MSKKTRPELQPRGWKSWPVLALLTTVAWIVGVLPARVVHALASFPAMLLFTITRWREAKLNRRGRGAQRNMKIVFGRDLSKRDLRRLTWRYSLHMVRLLAETLRLRHMSARRVARAVDTSELEPFFERHRNGEGLIFASGHFGNWEAMVVRGAQVLPMTSLARPCNEPGLQRFIMATRCHTGHTFHSKFEATGGLWALRKAVKRGEAVGLNVDENTREGGMFVPFCGTLAATNLSAAVLQRFTKAPIVVVTVPRTGPCRFAFKVWGVIEPRPEASAEEEKRRVTTEIARAFETGLRAYPDQWMWSLRRWETRPEGEALDAEGFPPRVEEVSALSN